MSLLAHSFCQRRQNNKRKPVANFSVLFKLDFQKALSNVEGGKTKTCRYSFHLEVQY